MLKFFSLLLFIAAIFAASSATSIPFIIWSTSNTGLDGLNDDSKFSSDLAAAKLAKENSNNFIVFVQKKLSLEDITKFGDVYNINGNGGALPNLKKYSENYNSRHLLLNSNDFVKHIQAFGNGVGNGWTKVFTLHIAEKKSDQIKHELNEISNQIKNGGKHLIVIYLSGENNAVGLKNNDGVIDMAMTNFMRSGAVTAILTAEEGSSLVADNSESNNVDYVGSDLHFEKRHILALNQNEAPAENGTLVNVTSSMLLYYKSIVVSQNADGIEKFRVVGKNVPVNSDKSKAEKNSTTAILNLEFKQLPSPIASLNLELIFNLTNKVWSMSEGSIAVRCLPNTERNCTSTNRPVFANWLQAPFGFSYHCSDGMPIETSIKNNATIVAFTGFQFQPFGIENEKFSFPNDCVGFFTIPIWSGLFTTLLLILILAYGIGMLAAVQTMDRFDDAKGKTIQVNTSE